MMSRATKRNQEAMRDAVEASDAAKAANALTDYVNVLGRSYGAFVNAILRSHRTLQQNVMRVFIQLCKAWSEERSYDARNADTIALAKRIIEAVEDEVYLPHI